MKTAIQLRDGGPGAVTARLLHGSPEALRPGHLGPIALVGPGKLVAYEINAGRQRRLFVFRTLHVDDSLAASVPGVHPRIQLLLDFSSAGRIRRIRGLLAHLVKRRRAPSDLSDGFYLRAAAALGGRLPPLRILLSLLAHEDYTGTH